MRRQTLAIVTSCLWGAVLTATAVSVLLLGPLWSLAAALPATATAVLASLYIARRADRIEARKLRALGHAVGLEPDEVGGIEVVARSLFGRLDRGRAFKLAIQQLSRPVLLVDTHGDIIALSRGLQSLSPDFGEGVAAAALLEEGGDVLAAEGMVMVAGRRYFANRQDLQGGRMLIELEAAGHHLGEDDFEGLLQALRDGRTSFKFDNWSEEHNPSIRALGEALAALDRGMQALDQLFKGQAVEPLLLIGGGGIASRVRLYVDSYAQVLAERDMALEARAGLQNRLDAIMQAIDRYRDSVSALADLADRSRAGLNAASLSMGKSRDRTFGLQQLEKEALALAADAALAAERNLRAVSGLNESTAAMERAVGTLEDASHKTSVVALNAAVEASRLGDRGATFSLLAGEVRNLAQVSQRSVREIRMLINSSRASIGASSGETGALQKTIRDLGIRLHTISTDTDMISGTLAEGSGTMARLDSHFGAVGSEAAKAILLPRPLKSDSAA